MTALNDQQNLLVTEPMDHLVGPTDVRDDGQPIGVLVEQHRAMRGDQLAVVVADQNRPRVLFDQPADHSRIFGRVKGVVTHEPSILASWRSAPRAPPYADRVRMLSPGPTDVPK